MSNFFLEKSVRSRVTAVVPDTDIERFFYLLGKSLPDNDKPLVAVMGLGVPSDFQTGAEDQGYEKGVMSFGGTLATTYFDPESDKKRANVVVYLVDGSVPFYHFTKVVMRMLDPEDSRVLIVKQPGLYTEHRKSAVEDDWKRLVDLPHTMVKEQSWVI